MERFELGDAISNAEEGFEVVSPNASVEAKAVLEQGRNLGDKGAPGEGLKLDAKQEGSKRRCLLFLP